MTMREVKSTTEVGREAWKQSASCKALDVDLWFSDPDDPKTSAGRLLCAICPVQKACLDYALETRSAHGVWGGLLPVERKRLLKQQDAGVTVITPLAEDAGTTSLDSQ